MAAADPGTARDPARVLALADPGATLAALVTVAGIWAVAIGVMRIVLAFELRSLPGELDEARGTAPKTGTRNRDQAPSGSPRSPRDHAGNRITASNAPQRRRR